MVILLGLVSPKGAFGQQGWLFSISGCVPDHYTTQNALYVTGGAAVEFGAGKTGYARWYCSLGNVNVTARTFKSLFVYYRDPDGMGTKSQIVVRLRRWSFGTGAVQTLTTFDSNTKSMTGFAGVWHQFSQTGDLSVYSYFIEILMMGVDQTVSPRVYGVNLF